MGKRFRSGVCAYCGQPGGTADHVFARGFFPEDLRSNLPQVVACAPCNARKSEIEHYLTTVLPFGGHHSLSKTILEQHVPPRLARNAKLHRALGSGYVNLTRIEGETEQRSLGVPYDHARMLEYLRYIARGLARAHWGCTIPQHYAVSAGLVTVSQQDILQDLFVLRGANYARGDLGKGLILYEGRQAVDDAALTMWRFLIYGGLIFGDDGKALEIPRDLWAITAAEAMPGLRHH